MKIDALIAEARSPGNVACYVSLDGKPVRFGTKLVLTVEVMPGEGVQASLHVSRLQVGEDKTFVLRSEDGSVAEETATFRCAGEVRLSGEFEQVGMWESHPYLQ